MSEAGLDGTGQAWAPPSAPAVAPPPRSAAAGSATASVNDRRAARRRDMRQRPIPLRPLTVLELIDGAVGAVMSVPRAVLLRAAVTVTGSAAAAFALTWWFNRAINTLVLENPTWVSTDILGDQVYNVAPSGAERYGVVMTEIMIAVVCSGFAATVLAGLFAPSVKAYVDAEELDATAVRAALRGRTARLYLLALLTTLPRLVPVLLTGMLARSAAQNPGGGYGGWITLVWLVAGPVCFWLTAATAVAAPAAVLEGASVRAALRRSRKLAARGLFRIGWSCLLTLLLVAAATASLDGFNWELRDSFGVGDQFAGLPGSPGFSWWLVAYAITYLLTLLLTTPYRAATATLLYVDRRFRREGLDIRIAWARLANNAARRPRASAQHGQGSAV